MPTIPLTKIFPLPKDERFSKALSDRDQEIAAAINDLYIGFTGTQTVAGHTWTFKNGRLISVT